MPNLLQIKKKIGQKLDEDNEKLKKIRIMWALDYAQYSAIGFMRRVQLIKLPDEEGFHQIEYDYKVWKAKRVLGWLLFTDLVAIMKQAGGNTQAAVVRFILDTPDILEENLNTHNAGFKEEVEPCMDSNHILILKDCFVSILGLHNYNQDIKDTLNKTIHRLDSQAIRYGMFSVKGRARSWNGERKIKML